MLARTIRERCMAMIVSRVFLGKNPGRVLSISRDESRRAKPAETHAL
jgi:hypothetical protein